MSTTTPRNAIEPLKKAPEPAPRHRGMWLKDFYGTAMGKKYAMAITGIMGLGFIIGHALGNLHVYEGALKFTIYGEALREIGEPLVPRTGLLWVARLGLLGALAVHVHAAYSLALMNRKKRPVQYQAPRDYIAADYANRTMVYTGTIVLAFIVFHLADLTWGWTTDQWVRGAITNNVVESLSRIPVAVFYIVAMLALGMHIFHGTWSLFQTLGWNNRRYNHWRRWLAYAVTFVVVGINLTFPLGTVLGLIECGAECEAVTEDIADGHLDEFEE